MNQAPNLPELINQINKTIQFLVDHDKLKGPGLQRWEMIYNKLCDYHFTNEAYINKLQEQNQALMIKHDYLEEKIIKLEAICLLHGIDNINLYLARPTEMLIMEAAQALIEGWTQLPGTLWKRIKAEDLQKFLEH